MVVCIDVFLDNSLWSWSCKLSSLRPQSLPVFRLVLAVFFNSFQWNIHSSKEFYDQVDMFSLQICYVNNYSTFLTWFCSEIVKLKKSLHESDLVCDSFSLGEEVHNRLCFSLPGQGGFIYWQREISGQIIYIYINVHNSLQIYKIIFLILFDRWWLSPASTKHILSVYTFHL